METQEIVDILKVKFKLYPIMNGFKCQCFNHEEAEAEGDGSLIINLKSYNYHCFGCGIEGSLDDLISLSKQYVNEKQ